MLLHVALSVSDSEEIENFFEEVLIFSIKHKFTIDSHLSRQLFNVNTNTDVYVLRQQDVEFEIFISPRKENRVFSHVCLSYQNPEVIYQNALKSGYKTFVKDGVTHCTWFIWDKSGNMFEIKKIKT